MSQKRNNKIGLLSLWIAGAVLASFAVVPSMAFAGGYDESKDESGSGSGTADNGHVVDTQTYNHVKTKTTTTDIHQQITKKEIVGTKTTITTKVHEDENGDTGEDAIAAAEAAGTSTSGDCQCTTGNDDTQESSDNGGEDESGEDGEEY